MRLSNDTIKFVAKKIESNCFDVIAEFMLCLLSVVVVSENVMLYSMLLLLPVGMSYEYTGRHPTLMIHVLC